MLEQEAQRRVDLQLRVPPLAYGVWVPGEGWLKDEQTRRCFAAVQIEVAQTAAQLYGHGARVLPFDESLAALAPVFLAREQERVARTWTARLTAWLKGVFKWANS